MLEVVQTCSTEVENCPMSETKVLDLVSQWYRDQEKAKRNKRMAEFRARTEARRREIQAHNAWVRSDEVRWNDV